MADIKLSLLVTSTLLKARDLHREITELVRRAGLYTPSGADELRVALLAAARESLREQGQLEAAATVEAARLALVQFGGAADANSAARAAAGLLTARRRKTQRKGS